jgi:hypothetical protein
MKYIHINNKKHKLLVFFNDMVKVGLDETFSSFKILNSIFNDYDILFIKDIKPRYWYLTIMEPVYNLIDDILKTNNYKYMYGLTSSSGTLCLLNTLHRFPIFKKSVIINGQASLCANIVNKYRHTCTDCCIFNKKIITELFNKKYLNPFNEIPKECLEKYIFYYCNSVSDAIYYNYVKEMYPINLHDNIIFDKTHKGHGGYVAQLLNDNSFLTKIKNLFDGESI